MDRDDQKHFRTIAAVSSKLPTDSLKKHSAANSHSGLDPAYLLQRARTLFACYRREEAADPEVYCAAVAAVLGDGYSRAVVEYVTDPRTGLPSRQKFLPNIAEIHDALDARAAEIHRTLTYDQRVAEQTRLTVEWLNRDIPEPLRQKADAWLGRTDPAAQALSGEGPKKITEAEREALIQDAKTAGHEIGSMKLREETIELIKQQDRVRAKIANG